MTVRVEVAVPDVPGVMLLAEKLQVVFLGNIPHERVVAALNPFTEVSVIVTVAGVPALTDALPGERAIVKSGGPGHTVTATLLDTDAALLVSPP